MLRKTRDLFGREWSTGKCFETIKIDALHETQAHQQVLVRSFLSRQRLVGHKAVAP